MFLSLDFKILTFKSEKIPMYKDASYKEKYADLQEWLPFIIEGIKKDLKNEHLKKDFYFAKKYFSSKNLSKLTTDDLVHAYQNAIKTEENGEALAEFITSRWLMQNADLYDFFETSLSQISPDFTSLEEIDLQRAQTIINDASREFGTVSTYIFSVLNSVVFPAEVFKKLAKQAKQEAETAQEEVVQLSEKMSIENMQKAFEREVARLTDKYEKKLSGLQKKYHTDIEVLKKKVAQLQRKLQEIS